MSISLPREDKASNPLGLRTICLYGLDAELIGMISASTLGEYGRILFYERKKISE